MASTAPITQAPPALSGPARVRRPRVRRGRLHADTRWAIVFLLPSFIGFLIFFFYPTLRGLYLSFTNFDLLRNSGHWIGLRNYREMFSDALFWNALKVTVKYVVINIGIQTVLALGIAVLMHRLTKSVIVRGILVLPWLIPNVVLALLWMWMLDPNLGIVNHYLNAVGIPSQGFLGSESQVIPTIAGINIWRNMGYTALLLFAGLMTIPAGLYEAAAIDGAGEWRMFRTITLPLLRPVLALVLVVTVIGSFQVFDTVNVATGGLGGVPGGPANASRVLYQYIFQQAFEFYNLGYAAALSVALIVLLAVVAFIQLRLLRASESDLA
ncbi:MAG: sugar ABC transporter permease [Solirubrobacterales bacterium]|nr:sugar ABC transporter permease [Solirubrobacterales bacterium]